MSQNIQPMNSPAPELPTIPTNQSEESPRVVSLAHGIVDRSVDTVVMPNKRRNIKYIGLLLIAIFIVAVALISFIALQKQQKPEPILPSNNSGNGALSGFEKKLNEKQLARLQAIKMPMYMPDNMTVENVILEDSIINNKTVLQYGHNLQFGAGPTKGSYGFAIYPASDNYKPPTDCGLADGYSASGPIACNFYEGSDEDLPAYVFTGLIPGAIQNTSGEKHMTMYAQKGEVVISISTGLTDPDHIYKIIKSMKRIEPRNLPESTMVSFGDN